MGAQARAVPVVPSRPRCAMGARDDKAEVSSYLPPTYLLPTSYLPPTDLLLTSYLPPTYLLLTSFGLWQLKQYERLLYIDADAVLVGPADKLFRLTGFAAERGLSGSWFNAGVMLLQPSQQTFDALVTRGAGEPCQTQNHGHGRSLEIAACGIRASLGSSTNPPTSPRRATQHLWQRGRLHGAGLAQCLL